MDGLDFSWIFFVFRFGNSGGVGVEVYFGYTFGGMMERSWRIHTYLDYYYFLYGVDDDDDDSPLLLCRGGGGGDLGNNDYSFALFSHLFFFLFFRGAERVGGVFFFYVFLGWLGWFGAFSGCIANRFPPPPPPLLLLPGLSESAPFDC